MEIKKDDIKGLFKKQKLLVDLLAFSHKTEEKLEVSEDG
jgi:hypothetical protein